MVESVAVSTRRKAWQGLMGLMWSYTTAVVTLRLPQPPAVAGTTASLTLLWVTTVFAWSTARSNRPAQAAALQLA